jgi:shikimate kinase
MTPIVLMGPSGVGKSSCIQALKSELKCVDMDLNINTNCTYVGEQLDFLIKRFFAPPTEVLALSVKREMVLRILQLRQAQAFLLNDFQFVYLRISDPEIHMARLRSPPAVGQQRSESLHSGRAL